LDSATDIYRTPSEPILVAFAFNHARIVKANFRLAIRVFPGMRCAHKHSRSGLLGVEWNNGTWRARIKVGARRLHLGNFKSKHEAHLAYLEAKRILHVSCTI
jgi:hypothetical protein